MRDEASTYFTINTKPIAELRLALGDDLDNFLAYVHLAADVPTQQPKATLQDRGFGPTDDELDAIECERRSPVSMREALAGWLEDHALTALVRVSDWLRRR